VASISVTICDESPLLQSIGPTVIKKKILEINKQDERKLNYPLNPVHKRSAPTLHVAPVKGRNLVMMEKKKHLPIDILVDQIIHF
jgi:hypothetical protein